MNINIKKLKETALIPTRADSGSAGYDLYADLPFGRSIIIEAHSTVKVPTNIAVEIPDGYFGGVYARSGLATKQGLRPANCTGVVDSSYRGNIFVALHNDSEEMKIINHHERIAQLIIQPYTVIDFNQVDELSETERGEGGFGSSGK